MQNNISEIDKNAKIIWDYMHLNHKLEKADLIFVMGSHDISVADRGTQIFLEGYAPFVLITGGLGKVTKDLWNNTEADVYKTRMLELGVPEDVIITENQATDTRENVKNAKKILDEKSIKVESVILVHKPYMERRAYATFKKLWPGIKVLVTSPLIEYFDYDPQIVGKDDWINLMVGDLQRIKILPDMDLQIQQDISSEVWNAYSKLVDLGYTKHLWKEY